MRDEAKTLDPDRFEAVLFDLDGVLTDTSRVHASAWKRTFDAFLEKRAAARGEAFRPFEIAEDYRLHVDGKPRLDGVRDFLRSRDIELPEGGPEDPPGAESVWGLGNQKNEMVLAVLEGDGVEAYPGSVALVRRLRSEGRRTAVVSSSRSCEAVLRAAGILELFELWVDGNVAAARGLPGKPAPDTFLEAAREMDIDPSRAVVVEDALSGVRAGRAGGFGLVIGVNRHDDADALYQHGADRVVDDLAELIPDDS